MNVRINLDSTKNILSKRKLDDRAQLYFASEVARLSDPFVPKDSGTLKNTRQVTPGKITYIQPYARRQWYENKGNGLRGKQWCLRMWAYRKNDITSAVAKFVGGRTR